MEGNDMARNGSKGRNESDDNTIDFTWPIGANTIDSGVTHQLHSIRSRPTVRDFEYSLLMDGQNCGPVRVASTCRTAAVPSIHDFVANACQHSWPRISPLTRIAASGTTTR